MIAKIAAVVVLLFFTASAWAADFYVGPAGAGDGSKAQPWSLQTAFSHPAALKPGDTVWLLNGTYGSGGSTVFTCNIHGTEAQPIIVRQYPGARATINGGIETGSGCTWIWWWGFEITNTSPDRKVQNSERPPGINLVTRGHKIINMVIHNTGHPAIGFWNPVGDGGEVYGAILFGNGLYDLSDPRFPDGWTRGSAIYAQNQTGSRLISDVISFRNFTTGMKVYTEGGWANGFTLEGNIVFDNDDWNIFATAKTNPMERLRVTENYTWREPDDSRRNAQFGYYTGQNDAAVLDNYFAAGGGEGLAVKYLATFDVQRNTVIGGGSLTNWFSGAAGTKVWNNNLYRGTKTLGFEVSDVAKTYAVWKQETGFDTGSQLTGLPAQNKIVVRPNRYESGRANIVVYNWENLAAVQVDLTPSGLPHGHLYEIRDSQNFFAAPIAAGIWNGTPVTIPLTSAAVAPIYGNVTHYINRHTSAQFNAFVLIPVEPPSPPGEPTGVRVIF